MVICFAADCSHRQGRETCSFFRFPTNAKKKALWTRVSRRGDRDPIPLSRLCSCHFVDGKKENGPSIFSYNQGSRLAFHSPEKKKGKKGKKKHNDSIQQQQININSQQQPVDVDASQQQPFDMSQLKRQIAILEGENLMLRSDIEKLQQEKRIFLFKQIAAEDKYVSMYTGLPNANVFYSLLKYLQRL